MTAMSKIVLKSVSPKPLDGDPTCNISACRPLLGGSGDEAGLSRATRPGPGLVV